MAPQVFIRRSLVPAPAAEAFKWHARPGAFQRLTPAWQPVELVEQHGGIEDGAQVKIRTGIGPLKLGWELEHRDCMAGEQFRDVQTRGPFARWRHTHRFEPAGAEACYLEDRIEYALPLALLADPLAGGFVRRKLERLFEYRHRTTIDDLQSHQQYLKAARMKVLVSGSRGLVGAALVPLLTTGGHEVRRLVRSRLAGGRDEVPWDPEAGRIETARIEGIDGVVHLAGENIAAGRWTDKQRAKILDSRVQGTRLLCETLARFEKPPRTLVCASAIGYYGDRGEESLDEQSSPGNNFLADVCRQWEAATKPAVEAGIRVVNLRFGVILSTAGGALAKMLTPIKLGVGGRIGSGKQFMSWITLDDAIGAIQHCLLTEELSGPVNAVSPQPATNEQFTKTLGKVLSRPTIFPLPAFAAKLMLGQMADELLLASARVIPARLEQTNYRFRQPELEGALRHVLGKA